MCHRRAYPAAGKGFEDGGSQAALGMMVLDQDQSTGFLCGLLERRAVDRLERIEIDDPGRDAIVAEGVGGGQALVQGNSGTDEGYLVFGAERSTLAPPMTNCSPAG